MTEKQLKKGDLVVFRYRIDCREVVSAEYNKYGEIKSLYVTDHEKTMFLKFEDRADDPVIELPISFDDVLAEILEVHKSLKWEYEHRYIDFDVEQVKSPFGNLIWTSKLSVEREEKDLPYGAGHYLGHEMTKEEVTKLAKELFRQAVNNFTLI